MEIILLNLIALYEGFLDLVPLIKDTVDDILRNNFATSCFLTLESE